MIVAHVFLVVALAFAGEGAENSSAMPPPTSIATDEQTLVDLPMKRLSFDFKDEKLDAVIAFLEKELNLRVLILHRERFDEQGITCRAENARVADALDLIFRQAVESFDWEIVGKTLVISHESPRLRTRIYPATDILLIMMTGTTKIDDWSKAAEELSEVTGTGLWPEYPWRDLTEAVQDAVWTNEWDENGGICAMEFVAGHNAFVITASPRVHRGVEGLFNHIRGLVPITQEWCKLHHLPSPDELEKKFRELRIKRFRKDMTKPALSREQFDAEKVRLEREQLEARIDLLEKRLERQSLEIVQLKERLK